MIKLISKLISAAIVSACAAGAAEAAVAIYVGPAGSCGASGCTAPNTVTSQLSSFTIYDFNSGLPGVYAGSGSIVTGSVSGQYATPFGDTTPYLTVGQNQSETLTPGGVHNVFGLYWGSVDAYNSIKFFLNNVLVDTFAGNDPRLTGITANGGQLTSNSNQYVTFLGLQYTSVQLSSTQFAFESDNHLVGDVPEPSTLALIAAALLSMFGLGYWRKQNA